MDKNNNSSIAVLIPCQGYSDYLKRCLSALSSQNDRDFEVIVSMADPITEDFETFTRESSPGVRFIKVTPTKPFSLSRIRNMMAKFADSDYFLFLDADRLVPTNFIQSYRDVWREQGNVQVYAYHAGLPEWFDSDWAMNNLNALMESVNMATRRGGAWGAFQGVPAKCFEQVDGYNWELESWGAEDVDLHERLVLGCDCPAVFVHTIAFAQWHPPNADPQSSLHNKNLCIQRIVDQFGLDHITEVAKKRKLFWEYEAPPPPLEQPEPSCHPL
ncbi:MAG: glycosyltransferase family A protein [bacterium]